MKFEVTKAGLAEAVAIVAPAVGTSGSDISTHFLFRVHEGVELLGFSGRLFASSYLTECELNDGEEGEAFTIEGKRLKMLLASIKHGSDELVFEFGEGEVKVTTPLGGNVFSSLDPNTFPYWDKSLNKAKKETTLEFRKFKAALTYCGKFVSDQVNKVPNICVVEYKNGTWYSTDQVVLSSVHGGASEDCNFRIFGKDLGSVLSYLNEISSYGDKIEVYTSDRVVAFKSVNGEDSPCFFGHSLYRHVFPDIGIDLDKEDHYLWTFKKDHLLNRIQFLNAGGKWDDPRLRFTPVEYETPVGSRGVEISVPSASGEEISVDLDLVHEVCQEDAPDFDGFFLSHPYLTRVIGCIPDDEIEMRINIKEDKKKGWVRFKWEMDKVTYHAVITWVNF